VSGEDAATTQAPATPERPLLFISHRTADKAIADVVRDFVTTRSSGNVDVFQTSTWEAHGPRIGGDINRELRQALWNADALILIFTRQEGDWSYCMWECGVATEPSSDDTNVIVFQCGRDLPRVFAHQVAVDVRNDGKVRTFVNNFLTSPNFFPTQERALTGFQPNDANVDRAAREFFEALNRVVPGEGDVEEWPALPYLQLEVGADDSLRIRDEPQPDKRLQLAREALLEAPIAGGDSAAARLFGMPTVPASEPLRVLVQAWTETYPQQETEWLMSLAEQITRAVQWQFPAVRWSLMRSTDSGDNTWYGPFVAHVRRFPNRAMQFDVYFQKFAGDSDATSIAIETGPAAP
jgi:hypothetical protein